MSERVTRSQTGRTPSKPRNPGFVETPGRRRNTRKSGLSGRDDSETPEPFLGFEDVANKPSTGGKLTFGHAYPPANGDAKGGANGASNGKLTFGHAYPPANGNANGTANGNANGATTKVKAEAEKIRKLDNPAIDTHGTKEFGGTLGMLSMMVGFPALMYYMWAGAYFYDGKFPTPEAGESWTSFLQHLGYLIKTEAYPHNKAWSIYWYFGLMQMAFYLFMPGIYRKGKPLPHLNGKQLDYYCSAMWSYYSTIIIALTLHFTGIFKLYTLIDEFGSIMSVGIISGFLCSFIAYFSALYRGATLRMTGYPVVDFFMGAELNPRLFGILDFKMFLEVRIPWFILSFLSLGTMLKQYELYGYVSGEAIFLAMAMWLYTNACAKGEHLIITTWDMYYEKLGFMLIFWNMAGVPLTYCHSILYVANHHPSEYRWPIWFLIPLIIAYLGVYYVWDTTNSQKNQFRLESKGAVAERKTFPYFKYGKIHNPKTIDTQHGNKILVDGWYGKARKIHYTCDIFFSTCWGLITGFNSPFPWFYSVFFFCMIMHRCNRDNKRCAETYGEAWVEYKKRVPYLFIPYVI